MRKILIALAAVAALVILMPMEASARQGGGGGGGRGGGWHGGGGGGGGGMRGLSAGRSFGRASFGGMRGIRTAGFRHFRAARLNGGHFRRAHVGGLGWHRGRFARRAGFLAAAPLLYTPYSYYFSDFGYDYGYSDGCYEPQPLLTPRGVIWQRTWVCY